MQRPVVLSCLLFLGTAACGDDAESTGSGGSASSSGDAGTGTSTTATGSATSGNTTSVGGGATTSAASTAESSGETTTGTGGGGAGGSGGGDIATSSGSGGAGGGAAVGCLQDFSAGHHEVSCEGGILYDVEIPAACTSGECGLIVDMHGYTMTADAQDENTNMRALGTEHGYVIVQPTAPMDGFGLPSWDQATHAPLVYAFLSGLASALPIDPARIHAMGFSQGGGMTFRLLCAHADFFASGAPIGALEGCEFSGPNSPSEEVDILQVHGRLDAVVNFNSVAVPQRDAALAAWAFGAPEVLESDDMHTATRWTTDQSTVFEFWEHDYTTSAQVVFIDIEGHCVPGGTDFDGVPEGYSCEDENTFVFGDLAMAFFEAHPKD